MSKSLEKLSKILFTIFIIVFTILIVLVITYYTFLRPIRQINDQFFEAVHENLKSVSSDSNEDVLKGNYSVSGMKIKQNENGVEVYFIPSYLGGDQEKYNIQKKFYEFTKSIHSQKELGSEEIHSSEIESLVRENTSPVYTGKLQNLVSQLHLTLGRETTTRENIGAKIIQNDFDQFNETLTHLMYHVLSSDKKLSQETHSFAGYFWFIANKESFLKIYWASSKEKPGYFVTHKYIIDDIKLSKQKITPQQFLEMINVGLKKIKSA